MLFSLRIGSLIFFSLAPLSTREDVGYIVFLPEARNSPLFLKKPTESLRIWVNRNDNILLEYDTSKRENFSEIFKKYNPQRMNKTVYLFADRKCKMEIINFILSQCRKNGCIKFVFVTYPGTLGIWEN